MDDIIKELKAVHSHLMAAQLRHDITQHYLNFLNTADRDQLKAVKGIGDKQVDWILELREESAQAFKSRKDLKKIELSEEEITNMLKNWTAQLFDGQQNQSD